MKNLYKQLLTPNSPANMWIQNHRILLGSVAIVAAVVGQMPWIAEAARSQKNNV